MKLDRDVRLAMLVCLLSWLALAAPWLRGQVTIPYDAKAHFQPQIQFLANALHTGQSPFWNPHVFGGSPQIADPQSLIFSPAVLLAALERTPSFQMFDGYVFLLLGLSALAIVMFFRERGWHPAGGVVAALAFAFGSSASWRIQHIGQIQSYVAFAVALWLLQRALNRRTIPAGIAAGIACALVLIEPDQVALLACYVLAGYVASQVLGGSNRIAMVRCSMPALLAAAVTAAALSALPLIMVEAFATATSRPGIPYAEAVRGSLHPASLLTAFVGDLFGAGNAGVDYWGPYSERWDASNLTLSQNMSQIYVGALPALLVLTHGIARGLAWHREIRFFTIAGGLVLLYGLGSYTPAFAMFYDLVPGVSLFRRPADATFMIGAMLAIVGGYLTHRMVCGGTAPTTSAQRRFEFAGIALVAVLVLAVAVRENAVALAGAPLIVAAASLAGAAAAIWAVSQRELSTVRIAVPMLALLMTVDLGANNRPNESTALPPQQYDVLRAASANKTIHLLKTRLAQPAGSPRRDRVELAGVGFDWPNAGMVHGFDHVLGYNPLRLAIATTALGADDTIAGWDQRRFTPLFPSYRSPLADMMGLRYIVTSVPAAKIDRRLRPGDLTLVAKTADGYIYENPRALPRAMFVRAWLHADFKKLVRTGAWPAFDPRRTVLLETPPPADPPVRVVSVDARVPVSNGTQPANVALRHYRNTDIEIEVDTPNAGLIVLNDVWHPWWTATVDGRPTTILKANVMFRAVPVPAGHHVVRFRFEPFRAVATGLLHSR